MTARYDLIVLGAGMAGISAANKAAGAGWRTAIVDELPYGGTCALRGCDPKKILRRGAEIIDAAADALDSTVKYFAGTVGGNLYVAANLGSGEADVVVQLVGQTLGDINYADIVAGP